MKEHYTVAVIGCGMAGMTCAIYLRRAGIDTVLVGDWGGSSLAYAPVVDNYPGVRHATGADILAGIAEQAESLGVQRVEEECLSLEKGDSCWRVVFENGSFTADQAVVATGRRPRLIGFKGEEELIGDGISTCALCDGALYQGKRVAVIGGGNTAIGDALYLSRIAEQVELLVRRDCLRATERVDEAEHTPNIGIRYSFTPVRIQRASSGKMVVVSRCGRTAEYDGVFYALGSVPRLDIVRGLDAVRIGDDGELHSYSPAGLHFCGDVRNTVLRQAVVAAADGATTAISVIDSLKASQRSV